MLGFEGYPSEAPLAPLFGFLVSFAGDAERGHGSDRQPFSPDRPAAFLTNSVGSVLNSNQRLVDLADQLALPIADPEHRDTLGFDRSPIARIRGIVFGSGHAAYRLPGIVEELATAGDQHFLELF